MVSRNVGDIRPYENCTCCTTILMTALLVVCCCTLFGRSLNGDG